MDKLVKGTIITIAAIALLATTALAAAMPLTTTFEKAGYSINWNEQTKTITIEKPLPMPEATDVALCCTNARVTQVCDGYFVADSDLGAVCIMAGSSTLCIGGTFSDIKAKTELEVYFGSVAATGNTPCIYADKIIIK